VDRGVQRSVTSEWVSRRRIYAGWSRSSTPDVDDDCEYNTGSSRRSRCSNIT